MLIHFQPRRLRIALARLVRAHPVTAHDLTDPRRIQKHFPNLLAALRERLNAQPMEALRELLVQLTELERALIPAFHLDPERTLRLKTLRLLALDPALVRLPDLLRAFQRFGPDPSEGPLLAEQALKADALAPPWRSLMTLCAKHPDAFATHFIDALGRSKTPLPDMLGALEVEPGSALGAAMERSVLALGPTAWALHSVDVALRAFKRADLVRRIDALIAAYNGRSTAAQPSGAFAKSAVNLPHTDAQIRQRLRERHPDVWVWLQELRLQEFFNLEGGHHGQERFAFWLRYLGGVQDIHVNAHMGRLFMDFGSIGIVEFLQSGNAVYAYDLPTFNALKALDMRSSPSGTLRGYTSNTHSAFKNRDDSVAWWTHSGAWQDKFKRKLAKLNIHEHR